MYLHKTGSLIAALLSVYIYKNFFYIFFGFVPLGLLFLIVMLVRRDQYKNAMVEYETVE